MRTAQTAHIDKVLEVGILGKLFPQPFFSSRQSTNVVGVEIPELGSRCQIDVSDRADDSALLSLPFREEFEQARIGCPELEDISKQGRDEILQILQ